MGNCQARQKPTPAQQVARTLTKTHTAAFMNYELISTDADISQLEPLPPTWALTADRSPSRRRRSAFPEPRGCFSSAEPNVEQNSHTHSRKTSTCFVFPLEDTHYALDPAPPPHAHKSAVSLPSLDCFIFLNWFQGLHGTFFFLSLLQPEGFNSCSSGFGASMMMSSCFHMKNHCLANFAC